jgi:hypothetical protein
MKELIQLVDASCPALPRKKKTPARALLSRRAAFRREAAEPASKKDANLKALIAQVLVCISGPNGRLAPACETKVLNVNQSLRILSMSETWTYARSKVLHLKIDRTEPDFPIVATVSVNKGEGRAFDESRIGELLAYVREQVAVLSAASS